MVQDRENKVRKDRGRARVQIEADAKENVPDNMLVDHGTCNTVDKVDHDVEAEHDGAGVTDANELFVVEEERGQTLEFSKRGLDQIDWQKATYS